MKPFLSILTLISFVYPSAFATYKSEKQQIYKYCDTIYSTTMEHTKGNPYPSLKPAAAQEIQSDPQKTNYFTICAFVSGFKSGFDKNYRKNFEAKKRSKITEAELNQIQEQFAEMIFADPHSVKQKLITGTYQDAMKYSDQKMAILLNNFGKK